MAETPDSRWVAQMRNLVRLGRQTLSWQGRASLKTFYGSIGLLYLIALGLAPLQLLAVTAPSWFMKWLINLPLLAGLLFFLVGALIRRLHDRGKRGWWLLIFFGPHAVGAWALSQIPITEQQRISEGFVAAAVLAGPFMAWGLVEIFTMRGGKGANRYGPDPLELGEVSAAVEL